MLRITWWVSRDHQVECWNLATQIQLMSDGCPRLTSGLQTDSARQIHCTASLELCDPITIVLYRTITQPAHNIMSDLDSSLKEYNVVPDVLSASVIAPNVQQLGVYYDGNALSPGEELARKVTLTKPEIRYNGAQAGQQYVLIMV